MYHWWRGAQWPLGQYIPSSEITEQPPGDRNGERWHLQASLNHLGTRQINKRRINAHGGDQKGRG
jgi:hypothetical protein